MKIDFRKEGKYLPHTWSTCVGAGRACEGLRAEWQRQLKEAVKECGFRYIRFHGLFAEDMFPINDELESHSYNWYYIDQLYDALLEIGIRPIVELGFMPPALASGEGTCFWWKGNITPPKDYDQWKDLVYHLTKHLVERYGLDEVKQWYFEVWNEPNLHGFWHGTKSQYFKLYEVSVEAIKAVHKDLKVGGPATSNFVPDERFDTEVEDVSKQMTHKVEDIDSLSWKGVWIQDFLKFCEEIGLPVDFVSTHPYPTDFALDGNKVTAGRSRHVDAVYEDITWLKKQIAASAYPDVEIHLTEWSSSPSSRDYSHDTLAEAAYIVRSNLKCSGMMDSLSYWVFTDIFEERGGGPEPFHGGFGLITMHGIKKSSYYAYKMLHQLGEWELERDENSIVTKDENGKVKALFYHYPKEMNMTIPMVTYGDDTPVDAYMNMGTDQAVQLVLEHTKKNAVFCLEVVDDASSPFTVWRKMGKPKNLTREMEKTLKSLEHRKLFFYADDEGKVEISFIMKPWEIAFLSEQ
ncbi:hypothetical protein CE91St56_28950 [Lachnospiraceae bacterium]|nr:hypothetical protein CE91St56_28950 [Lachnospiraceae bacterium]GKH41841.1 hypothetical protein CE91St57_28150 [Lachnospiraceae bacterium]